MGFFGDSSGFDIATGAVDALSGIVNSGLNIANWFRQDDWQKRTWRREDNAIQRRVADLKAAGLSPVLAAGSAAASGAPLNTRAPDTKIDLTGLMQQKENIASTRASRILVNNQVKESHMRQTFLDAQTQKEWIQADLAQKELDILNHDFSLAQDAGVRYDIKNGWSVDLQQLKGLTDKIFQRYFPGQKPSNSVLSAAADIMSRLYNMGPDVREGGFSSTRPATQFPKGVESITESRRSSNNLQSQLKADIDARRK
jgi:hypothetical protein